MKVIADSSSTRTEGVLVDGDKVVERAFTQGYPKRFSVAVGNTFISMEQAVPMPRKQR